MKGVIIGFVLVLITGGYLWITKSSLPKNEQEVTIQVTPTPLLLTPTPKPITFEELNKKYGPCTRVSVLIYHHIQEETTAKEKHQDKLSVSPEYFRKHLEYLKTHGYNVVAPKDLINFFDNSALMPDKAVLVTLDDAYADNYTEMWPILKEFGFKATIFTPTGLVENPDYLNWNQIKEMSGSGLVTFANHTWSHQSSNATTEVLEREISIAETQLSEHEQNVDKVFAYPYGNSSTAVKETLFKIGYKLAFTTRYGNIMCKGQRFDLPRIRVANAPLGNYGL